MSLNLAVGDKFNITGAGHPKTHVFTVEEIRPARHKYEGDGMVYDLSEVGRMGTKMEYIYTLAENILEGYQQKGFIRRK